MYICKFDKIYSEFDRLFVYKLPKSYYMRLRLKVLIGNITIV